ncbi:TrbC/VirB2 family protein [Sphingobium yanoikuyae]|uniref:TrbC/VIRB2 family protein n=1 Tax=Sphingobium yanoikuyae TaxID=13690 RepID=A0A9X7YCS9_SPHYA|nr:TrbC/VirB2 family protein [Sphingobium yanoikuyae]QNG45762.1 TrbC/VIRB2 family protein [Sphingobium yanoikuyae]
MIPGSHNCFLPKRALAILSLLFSGTAFSQTTFNDPAGSGPIVGALQWLQGTLLGTVATVAAVIAVAAVGFMMLTGRMNWRYGAVVILGCFILFGAASIVGGIQSAASPGY